MVGAPRSLESPQPKRAAVKPRMEKNEMVFLFQVMPQSSPTLCVKGDEFSPLLEVVWLHTHPLFTGDFWQCPPVVSRGSRAIIVSAAFLHSILWHQVHVLTLTKNMKLCVNPLSKPYVEYLLRVGNGQKFSIIDHFPSEAGAEPSFGVKIAVYLEIHQTPFLNTFIHVVFLALVINYANQGYMDGQAIMTTKNTIVNSLNI